MGGGVLTAGVGDTELTFSLRASGGADQWAARHEVSAEWSGLETRAGSRWRQRSGVGMNRP